MKILRIVGIIAAAGNSQRMGFHKALLSIQGKTTLCWSLEQLHGAGLKDVYVTLPPALVVDSSLRMLITTFGGQVASNWYPQQGYAGSIRTILEIHKSLLDGIIVTPVDSPIFSKKLLVTMIKCATLNKTPKLIVPHFYERPGHPVYLSHHFLGELISEKHQGGIRALIHHHKSRVCAVFSSDKRVLLNLNRAKNLIL
jgi:CTP:molybdopterin cytidylyltransferase MocA